MISETDINGWNNKMVKHSKVVYPQCLDSNTPQNYFLALFVGARGSGKTYLLTKLLKTLEEKKIYENGKVVAQRIILISSTAHSDSNRVFKSLKNLDWNNDVIDSYTDSLLIDKMEELKKDTEEGKDYKLYRDVWKKFKVIDDVDDLTQDEMLLLNKFNFIPFKDIPVPTYKDGFITHYVIDDMIGSNIFKNGKSPFTNLCIRNRHVTPSILLLQHKQLTWCLKQFD